MTSEQYDENGVGNFGVLSDPMMDVIIPSHLRFVVDLNDEITNQENISDNTNLVISRDSTWIDSLSTILDNVSKIGTDIQNLAYLFLDAYPDRKQSESNQNSILESLSWILLSAYDATIFQDRKNIHTLTKEQNQINRNSKKKLVKWFEDFNDLVYEENVSRKNDNMLKFTKRLISNTKRIEKASYLIAQDEQEATSENEEPPSKKARPSLRATRTQPSRLKATPKPLSLKSLKKKPKKNAKRGIKKPKRNTLRFSASRPSTNKPILPKGRIPRPPRPPRNLPAPAVVDNGALFSMMKDRLRSVLGSIDIESMKRYGFAHLFNNVFSPPEDFTWYKQLSLNNLEWKTLKNRNRKYYEITIDDTGLIVDHLHPMLEVVRAMQEILPRSSFPVSALLRSGVELKERQNCHLDNKDFHRSVNLVDSFEDMSYSLFFGLEDNTYLGLAKFDGDRKLIREVVHIKPGSMLMISGNQVHYGTCYRGSGTQSGKIFTSRNPSLMDNVRGCAFIHPPGFHTNTQSQLWFSEDEDPLTYPHRPEELDSDLPLDTKTLYGSSSE